MLVMTKKVFVYIWKYIVIEEHLEEFKRIYEPEGDWAQLFKKADGYLATDLHQDKSNAKKFVTVDFWKTKDDRDNFRNQFSEEFKALDEHCESFTEREELIGDFDSYTNRLSNVE